jgi:hypothetical protein
MSLVPRKTNSGSSFYDPAQEAEAKRRRRYAELLQSNAKMPESSEMVSGIVVKRSPLELLAKAIQGGMGAYNERKADELDTQASQRRQQMWAQALQNPDQAVFILGQDPSTAPDAFKMQMESTNDLRDFEQQKEIARINAEAMAPYRQLQAQGLQSQLDKQRMLSEATAALGGGSTSRPSSQYQNPSTAQDIMPDVRALEASGVEVPTASSQNMPATPEQLQNAVGQMSLANLSPEQQALIAVENPALYKQLSEASKLNKPSATEQKEFFEAQDIVNSGPNLMSALDEAIAVNNKAYSGMGADERAWLVSNVANITGNSSPGADATVKMRNLITGQALENLKSIFGGMPTEGERKVLLEMQASTNKTPSQRADILSRAKAMAKRRVQSAQERMSGIATGDIYKNVVPPMASAPEVPAQAPAQGKRLRYNPSTGGFE